MNFGNIFANMLGEPELWTSMNVFVLEDNKACIASLKSPDFLEMTKAYWLKVLVF